MSDLDLDALVEQTTEAGQLRRDLRVAAERIGLLTDRVVDLDRQLRFSDAVAAAVPRPPKWTRAKAKKHGATLVLLLTDLHLDETVDPAQVGGLNDFDRAIALARLERLFVGATKFAKDYAAGLEVGNAIVLWGGDIVSGEIHSELTESNEGTVVETLIHWLEPLQAGVTLLADEFGRVHNVAVVGNHGRRQARPRYKARAHDNFDWLLYGLLARGGDERITWQIPDSLWADIQIHNSHVRLEHGDEAKGGTGISAAMAPLLLRQHRLSKIYASANRPLDLLVTGHLHRRHISPGLVVGGSLKGDDEYSLGRGFDHAPASQELMLIGDRGG